MGSRWINCGRVRVIAIYRRWLPFIQAHSHSFTPPSLHAKRHTYIRPFQGSPLLTHYQYTAWKKSIDPACLFVGGGSRLPSHGVGCLPQHTLVDSVVTGCTVWQRVKLANSENKAVIGTPVRQFTSFYALVWLREVRDVVVAVVAAIEVWVAVVGTSRQREYL